MDLTVPGEQPFLVRRPGPVGVAQAVVVGEIFRLRGRAALAQVGGRGAGDETIGSQGAGDQSGVRERTYPKRRLHVLVDQVDEAIGQEEVDFDLGMVAHVAGDHRGETMRAECHGRADAQATVRLGAACAGERVSRFNLRQHDAAAFVVGATRLGQALAPGRAVEQAHTELRLQRGDVAGDHLRREAERARCGGEGACVGGCDEHGHAGEPIQHCVCSVARAEPRPPLPPRIEGHT